MALSVFATAEQTCEGFVLLWHPSVKDHDTLVLGGPRDTQTLLYYHLRLAPRERSLDEMQSV